MLGYQVSLPSGATRDVPGEQYEIADDGSLVIRGGGTEIDRIAAGGWIQVTNLGTRLAEVWPPATLALVIDNVAELLGVRYGHFVYELRDLDRFADWRLNDLESLTRAVLEAVDEDPDSTNHRHEQRDVRLAIARGFGIGLK